MAVCMSRGKTFCVSSYNEIGSRCSRKPFNNETQNVASLLPYTKLKTVIRKCAKVTVAKGGHAGLIEQPSSATPDRAVRPHLDLVAEQLELRRLANISNNETQNSCYICQVVTIQIAMRLVSPNKKPRRACDGAFLCKFRNVLQQHHFAGRYFIAHLHAHQVGAGGYVGGAHRRALHASRL